MQLNPAEISELIKSRIEGLGSTDIKNQGTVVSVTDGICRVHGLSDVMQGEMLEFPATARTASRYGLALNLERDSVGAVILGEYEHISEGDTVKCTGRILEVPGRPRADRPRGQRAGPADRRQGPDQRQDDRRDREGRAGRDRAPVGEPAGADRPEVDRLDGARRPRPARADHRRPPDRQDRGGDRHDHQPEGSEHDLRLRRDRPEGLVGQERGARWKNGAMDYTIVVAATASESAAMQYVSAYSGCTMGEYFRDRGEDALIVYDDLSKQAVAYRQVSLLLRRPPGREAYPGDVFYLHSRLLERAARVNADYVEKPSPRARSRARPAR
jgi:F-type H+-transporting ATPase subunit alpha